MVLYIMNTHRQDKQLIKGIIWRLCDTFETLYDENDQKCGRRETGNFIMTMHLLILLI